MSIIFKNINLENITKEEQFKKLDEEISEFHEALLLGTENEVKEELLDMFQASIGVALKERNITAKDIMDYYPEWQKKLKKRPR